MSYDAYIVFEACDKCNLAHPSIDIGNMTSNVAGMWEKALGISLKKLNGRKAEELIPLLEQAVKNMEKFDTLPEYRVMEPKNGWGTYHGALNFLKKILIACKYYSNGYLELNY